MIKVYGISNCTSVRNALNFFKEKGKDVYFVNLRNEKPTWQEMQDIKEKSGFDLLTLFNTNGKLFEKMQLAEKLKDLSQEEALKILVSDALLFKRPLVVDGDYVRVGWNKKEYAQKWYI